jgi:hypothetical protein
MRLHKFTYAHLHFSVSRRQCVTYHLLSILNGSYDGVSHTDFGMCQTSGILKNTTFPELVSFPSSYERVKRNLSSVTGLMYLCYCYNCQNAKDDDCFYLHALRTLKLCRFPFAVTILVSLFPCPDRR